MSKYNKLIKEYLKSLNEGSGMISRIPSCGISVDTEEGQSEEQGKKLSWSKTISKYLKN